MELQVLCAGGVFRDCHASTKTAGRVFTTSRELSNLTARDQPAKGGILPQLELQPDLGLRSYRRLHRRQRRAAGSTPDLGGREGFYHREGVFLQPLPAPKPVPNFTPPPVAAGEPPPPNNTGEKWRILWRLQLHFGTGSRAAKEKNQALITTCQTRMSLKFIIHKTRKGILLKLARFMGEFRKIQYKIGGTYGRPGTLAAEGDKP